MELILLGAALAALGGAWTAALLWIAAGLPRRGPGERARGGGETEAPEEELLRGAAVQEGFDNLMRYSVGTGGRDGRGPREEL